MKSEPAKDSVCLEGNYKSVYKLHSQLLRNFIYYKCGDLPKAEDIVQEAFVRLWGNCKQVVLDKAKSFLFTVANRLFIDSVRHAQIQLRFMKETVSTIDNHDPEYHLREAEFKQQLEKAISDLPENQREVFLMNRIDKMTYVEIAEVLDLGVKAVEKRMHLALLTLKDRIKELNHYKI